MALFAIVLGYASSALLFLAALMSLWLEPSVADYFGFAVLCLLACLTSATTVWLTADTVGILTTSRRRHGVTAPMTLSGPESSCSLDPERVERGPKRQWSGMTSAMPSA